MGVTVTVAEYLEEQNISPSDVAPFVIIHTVLSALLVGSTWFLCHTAAHMTSMQPAAKSLGVEEMPRSALINSFVAIPFISDSIKRSACNSLVGLERSARNSRLVAYLDRKFSSMDATRLCVSYAEAKLGRLFFKPFTIPGRIWLSWTGTKAWQQLKTRTRKLDTTQEIDHLSLKSSVIDQRSNNVFNRKLSIFHPKSVSSLQR